MDIELNIPPGTLALRLRSDTHIYLRMYLRLRSACLLAQSPGRYRGRHSYLVAALRSGVCLVFQANLKCRVLTMVSILLDQRVCVV